MAPSHPPTLRTLVARALRDPDFIPKGSRVLAAVSGGPDSMAMLHVLTGLAPRHGFSVLAFGVDHGLRASAAAELDGAEAFAASIGVPFGRARLGLAPGGNLHARARAARYAALRAAARELGAARIATAHHADDRAETVLLRLLRGSGPRGLAVLPPRADDLVRPLLRARRRDIEAHLARHRIPFARDPSNDDPRFDRARVRHEVLPLLEELSPNVVGHLNALADQLSTLRHGDVDVAGTALARATEAAIRLFAQAPWEASDPAMGAEGIEPDAGPALISTAPLERGDQGPAPRPEPSRRLSEELPAGREGRRRDREDALGPALGSAAVGSAGSGSAASGSAADASAADASAADGSVDHGSAGRASAPRAADSAQRAFTVELPGGLVASYDRGSLTITVVKSPKSAPRWKHRSADGTHPKR